MRAMDSSDLKKCSPDQKCSGEPSAGLVGIISMAVVIALIVALTALSWGAPWWSALAIYSGVGCVVTIGLSVRFFLFYR